MRKIAALVGTLGLLLSPAVAAATSNCDESGARAAPRQDFAAEVVRLTNAHRASLGLSQLVASPSLTRSALWKSNHMATMGYFAHEDPAPPVQRSVGQRVSDCGYPGRYTAENIAMGNSEAAATMQQWLNSPGHRRNIENPSHTEIGVGSAGQHWTQNFGDDNPGEPRLAPPAVAPDAVEIAEDSEGLLPVTANDAGEWLHVTTVDSTPLLEAAEPSEDGRGVTLRPAQDFHGTVTLDLRVGDLLGQQAQSTATIRVLPVNDPPTASDDRVRLRRAARRVLVRPLADDGDVDGDALRIVSVGRGRYGAVRLLGDQVRYTPRRRRWPGHDTVTYRVADPSGAVSRARIELFGPRRR